MRAFILIIVLLLPISFSFAGDKVFTESDLEDYSYPSDNRVTESKEYDNKDWTEKRISYFDLQDIESEIDKTNKAIDSLKSEMQSEIEKCSELPSYTSFDIDNDKDITSQIPRSKLEKTREVCEEIARHTYGRQIYELEALEEFMHEAYNELKDRYERQE